MNVMYESSMLCSMWYYMGDVLLQDFLSFSCAHIYILLSDTTYTWHRRCTPGMNTVDWICSIHNFSFSTPTQTVWLKHCFHIPIFFFNYWEKAILEYVKNIIFVIFGFKFGFVKRNSSTVQFHSSHLNLTIFIFYANCLFIFVHTKVKWTIL